MMVDPEEILERRRESALASAAEPVLPAEQSPGEIATAAVLARLRDGDDQAAAHRWLARIRSDLRPRSSAELDGAIVGVAGAERIDPVAVRAGIDRLLRDVGGVEGWGRDLDRRTRQLGGRAPVKPRQLQMLRKESP